MKSYKFTVESEFSEKVQPESFRLKKKIKDKVVQYSYPKEGGTTNNECEDVLSLIKNNTLAEIGDDFKILEVLKGGCFVRRVTTTEYFIVDGEGKNLLGKINDDYVKFLAGYDDGTHSYTKQGDEITKINLKK